MSLKPVASTMASRPSAVKLRQKKFAPSAATF